ncbi:hypothetical protein FO675_00045 [Riemerella anatipestifer]|uniref:hypothetical protein n=1 Tax=Riemerella anatipestifer TaxID=34085 RepID=UPI0013751F56|nr:hypothetical protein [Riemerella anatipestifer]MBO4232710.1 hypothetical protein [Riemerella anatipestifer]
MLHRMILPIAILISFLSIGISYNNSPTHSIFIFLVKTIENNLLNGFFINFKDYPMDFSLIIIEIFLVFSFFIYSVILNGKKIKIMSVILLMIVWLKNFILLDFVIDQNKYFFSSIPFIILSLYYLVLMILKKEIRKNDS